ncbi:SWIM zinc finger family protein [Roseibium album]|uniref:SWIM zinc finger family protein n=1 Tax=Roseibium album TaxID=311410 RepID=UPI00329783AB
MSAIDRTYRYACASAYLTGTDANRLSLTSDSTTAFDGSKRFLEARALIPDISAKGLRAVSEVVAARYYVPPAMLAKTLREADPVATVSPGAVRFEGFSSCCSVYARMDLNEGALDVSFRRNGTTNVDFGPELRGALANVGTNAELRLSIAENAVGITRNNRTIVEKKVPLPSRWIKGFAEVQVVMANMRPTFRLPRVAAQRFLRALPRGKNDQVQFVSVHGGAAQLSARPNDGSIPLRGSHRLRVLEPMVGRSEGLEVFTSDATGASAWALDFGVQRFWLVLNADPWRGFSGDGGTLSGMAKSGADAVSALRAQLNWQDQIDVSSLAKATGHTPQMVESALAELAARGLVGFDLSRNGYFHRVLPFDLEQLDDLNPRQKAAIELLDDGAVKLTTAGADVTSQGIVHSVNQSGEGWCCTCPWFAKHGRKRGPCKHVLAVEMQLEKQA